MNQQHKTRNGDMPATPLQNEGWPSLFSAVVDQEGLCTGLTKREQFAMAAMQGLLSSFGQHDVTDYGEIASDSVMAADTLLAELDKARGEL